MLGWEALVIEGSLSVLTRITTSEDEGVANAHRSVIHASHVSRWSSQQSCIGLFGMRILCFCFRSRRVSLTSVSLDLSSSIYFDSRNANDGGASLACIQLQIIQDIDLAGGLHGLSVSALNQKSISRLTPPPHRITYRWLEIDWKFSWPFPRSNFPPYCAVVGSTSNSLLIPQSQSVYHIICVFPTSDRNAQIQSQELVSHIAVVPRLRT